MTEKEQSGVSMMGSKQLYRGKLIVCCLSLFAQAECQIRKSIP